MVSDPFYFFRVPFFFFNISLIFGFCLFGLIFACFLCRVLVFNFIAFLRHR